MKTLIAVAAAIIISNDAMAAGFAPWNESRAAERADAEQKTVNVGPYYRDGIPARADKPSTNQADVVIEPWYARGRV